MVKREKSPEIADDARYFTVYQPYPIARPWDEEDVQKACATWVAECIGPSYLWALHVKPSARNMILLEVSKDFEDHGKLLGEHRWREFLKDPTEEEEVRFTQVFHSFYARGRDAQKDGWKVVTVNSKWFYKWTPGDDRIVDPYPATHWCATPSEDKTQKTLCRPLPAEQKLPPPPRSQPVVVGSTDWVAKQGEVPPTKAELTQAWSKGGTPSSTATPLLTETDPTSSGASSPSIQPLSPLSPVPSVPASPALRGRTAWGRTIPLQKFVTEAVRSNTKAPGWQPVKPAASPVGAKSPLAEEPPKGPVNAWTKPLVIPEPQRPKPSPPVRNESQWGPDKADYSAWTVKDTTNKDEYRNTSATEAPSTSTCRAPPSSPRNGRNKESKDLRGDSDRPPSPRRDHPSDGLRTHSSLGRDSTSRTREGHHNPDTADARGRRSQWDMPTPEQSTKHKPKPWDKKKKEKETIETMYFGEPQDWRAHAQPKSPDTKPMEVDSGALVNVDSEGGNKAKESSGSATKYKGKKSDDQRGSGEGLSKDTKKSFKRGELRIRMEDLTPGRSAGRWDHGGYDELKAVPKKFNDAKGKQRNNTGKGAIAKQGGTGKGKQMEQEIVESVFSDLGMNDSAYSPAGRDEKKDTDIPPITETAWVQQNGTSSVGERGAARSEDNLKKAGPVKMVGKWGPSLPSTGDNKPNDFHNSEHSPHKTRPAALGRTEDNKEGGKDKEETDVDMVKVSEILSPYNQSKQEAKTAAGPVSGSSTSENKQPNKFKLLNQYPDDNFSMTHSDNDSSLSAENGGVEPEEVTRKGKGKANARLLDDEASGMDPEPGNPSGQLWRNEKHFKDDSVNWGAPQGNPAEWGLAPELLDTSENLDEEEFYAWERENPAQPTAPEGPPVKLPNKYLKTLKCPTHNYYCKKSICKDMAKLVKDEEQKARMGTPSRGQDHDMNDGRKAPTRSKGSKHGPRVKPKREPSTFRQLRGYKSDESGTDDKPERSFKGKGKEKREKGDKGNENARESDATESKIKVEEVEPVASSSRLDATNSWGVTIGSNLGDWGVQTSLEAWMS